MAGFLIFDVESIPDGNFLSRCKYPGENLSASKAIQRAEHEAKADSNGRTDFIPLTYQVPVACGIARTDENFNLINLRVYTGDTDKIVDAFWRQYGKTDVTLVSFNGRTFDLPLLELMAFKFGFTLPRAYWGKYGPRNRFSDAHLDLMEFIGNFGASKVIGGLDALAKFLGRTGKTVVEGVKCDGQSVQKLYAEGKIDAIKDYCARDVLDTYAVLLRTRVMTGQMTPDEETSLIARSLEVSITP